MSSQNESILLDFQKLLEHNEDILAAIVENFQLDRMEDCISHYLILQSNLISLGDICMIYPLEFQQWHADNLKDFLCSGHADAQKLSI